MAAVLGGTQSLHTNSRDEALALPTEDSARIALRTQQIIAHETGVANTIDPFGGAHEIERRTSEIEQGAQELLGRIDAMGGTLAAIETGYIQRQIQDSAYKAQVAVDDGTAVVVGVNRYQSDDASRVEMFQLDPEVERQQVARVRAVRQARDHAAWRAALDAVGAAARGRDNLVPPIIAAVEARATVGEIADALRAVFGEYREAGLDA
jgi:methylmalonyl-CoA mutase N-terminal domain/subunit